MILGLNLNFKKEKMENGFYVISRDQVNLDLNIVECKNETVAKQLINENRKRYVDSIHLTLNDLEKLNNTIKREQILSSL